MIDFRNQSQYQVSAFDIWLHVDLFATCAASHFVLQRLGILYQSGAGRRGHGRQAGHGLGGCDQGSGQKPPTGAPRSHLIARWLSTGVWEIWTSHTAHVILVAGEYGAGDSRLASQAKWRTQPAKNTAESASQMFITRREGYGDSFDLICRSPLLKACASELWVFLVVYS